MRALSGSYDNTLRVWDVDSAQCVQVLEGHTDTVHCVAALPDSGMAKMIYEVSECFIGCYLNTFGESNAPAHDVVTIMYLLRPEIFTSKAARVEGAVSPAAFVEEAAPLAGAPLWKPRARHSAFLRPRGVRRKAARRETLPKSTLSPRRPVK